MITGARQQFSINAEWHRLSLVALVAPTYFEITSPVNRTQRHFYGSADPDIRRVEAQHRAARAQLIAEGVTVLDIPPRPGLPLQFNVRDAAAVIGELCVLGRMRRPLRADEPGLVRRAVEGYGAVAGIDQGTLEGGDVQVAGDEVFVGLSDRSDAAGAAGLASLLAPGHTVTTVPLAPEVLHLDVAMNLVSPGAGLVHRPSLPEGPPRALAHVDWIEVTDEEYDQQGANVLPLGDGRVMHDSRHVRIADELKRRGVSCIPVELDEISKVGGGIRCMTLPLVRTA